jgi:hypothetical protein
MYKVKVTYEVDDDLIKEQEQREVELQRWDMLARKLGLKNIDVEILYKEAK